MQASGIYNVLPQIKLGSFQTKIHGGSDPPKPLSFVGELDPVCSLDDTLLTNPLNGWCNGYRLPNVGTKQATDL